LFGSFRRVKKGRQLSFMLSASCRKWSAYEDIKADIFDHLLAVAPLFDLRLFQNPTGSDFRAIRSAAAVQASNLP
jgi:miniconductance mechanosensitive channel